MRPQPRGPRPSFRSSRRSKRGVAICRRRGDPQPMFTNPAAPSLTPRMWLTEELADALRAIRCPSGRVFHAVPKWDHWVGDVRGAGLRRHAEGA